MLLCIMYWHVLKCIPISFLHIWHVLWRHLWYVISLYLQVLKHSNTLRCKTYQYLPVEIADGLHLQMMTCTAGKAKFVDSFSFLQCLQLATA